MFWNENSEGNGSAKNLITYFDFQRFNLIRTLYVDTSGAFYACIKN